LVTNGYHRRGRRMQIERRKRAGAGGGKEKACGGEAVGSFFDRNIFY